MKTLTKPFTVNQPQTMFKKEFNFKMPLVKSYDSSEDDHFHIQFGISSNEEDMDNEQMTDNALEDIVTQAKGIGFNGLNYTGINIDDYHIDGLRSLIGPVTDSWVEKNGDEKIVMVDLKVRSEWEKTIRDIVDSGMALGGSITGRATKRLPMTSKGISPIDGVQLFKAALTDIPSAWMTRGTAHAIQKACPICSQIRKSLTVDLEKVKKIDYEVNQTCMQWARTAIKNGDIDNGSWSKPSFSDFDNDIEKYKKVALAVHPDLDPELAGSYGFEIGKGNGKVSRQGVIAAKTAAAGSMSSKGKNKALYDAADELLQLIDEHQADEEKKKTIGGYKVKNKLKKDVIGVDDAFETIQSEVGEELDRRYGTPNAYGGISRDCYIAWTTPDFVIICTYDGDYFQVPFTRTTGDDGDIDVTLEDPVPVTLQMITKSLENVAWMVKSEKPELKKTLPDGLDESFVTKLKNLGEDGKQFIKNLFGVEGPKPAPGISSEPNNKGGDGEMKKEIKIEDRVDALEKKIGTQEDLIKSQGKTITDQGKVIKGLQSDNEELKKTNKELKKDTAEKDHTNLVKNAVDLHKKLNPAAHGEPAPNYTEEDMKKALKEDYGYTDEEIEKDLDGCLKGGVRVMKGILKKAPNGQMPNLFDGSIEKDANKYANEVKKLRSDLDKQGRE